MKSVHPSTLCIESSSQMGFFNLKGPLQGKKKINFSALKHQSLNINKRKEVNLQDLRPKLTDLYNNHVSYWLAAAESPSQRVSRRHRGATSHSPAVHFQTVVKFQQETFFLFPLVIKSALFWLKAKVFFFRFLLNEDADLLCFYFPSLFNFIMTLNSERKEVLFAKAPLLNTHARASLGC